MAIPSQNMLEFNLASEKLILFSARAHQVKTLVDDFILELKKVRARPRRPAAAPEQGSRTRTWCVPARPAWGARGPCVAVVGPRLCRLAPHSCRILHGGLWAPPAGATLPTAVAVRPHAPPGPAPGPCAEALVAGGGARPVLCCPLTLSPSWGGQPWLWRGMGRQPSAGLC